MYFAFSYPQMLLPFHLSLLCFSLQYPRVNYEWPVARNMERGGIDAIINDLFRFMRREVLHQQGMFFDHNGALKEFPELSLYQNMTV